MSYFHTGTRTIIGAEAFHGPVRNGKAWDHLAMATRHKLYKLLEAITSKLCLLAGRILYLALATRRTKRLK